MIFSTPSSGGASGIVGCSGAGSALAACFPGRAAFAVFFAGFIAAESRSSCAFSSPLSPSLSITFRKLTSPFLINSSPIGLRQLVGGFMSFVSPMALCSSSAIARFAPSTRGLTGFLPPLTLARISPAADGDTRLNAVCRKPRTSWLFDSRAMSISAPSSTPCGCGLISTASFGSSLVARGKLSVSLPGLSAFSRWAAPTGRL